MNYRQPFKMDWPITQDYGETVTSNFHTGIDYGCPLNTPILASGDGTVMFAGWDKTGYGNMVIVSHPDGQATLYAHLSSIHVNVGEKVRQGSLIGHSGSTGNSTGPHLHFEARKVWGDYKTHFDPKQLPLMSVVDQGEPNTNLTNDAQLVVEEKGLKTGPVIIEVPYGAYGHSPDFTSKQALPFGTKLNFTGKTIERNGLTFCECALWIAESDGELQILMNIQS